MCTQGGLGEVRFHRRGSSTPRNKLAAALLLFPPARSCAKASFAGSALSSVRFLTSFPIHRQSDASFLVLIPLCSLLTACTRYGHCDCQPAFAPQFPKTRFGQRPDGSEKADGHFPASRNKRSASVDDFGISALLVLLQLTVPHTALVAIRRLRGVRLT